jgi:hypothetical protein
MVNTLLRRTGIALLSGSLILLSFISCTNSDEIGLNLTPPGEKFQFVVDSTTLVTAMTLRQDSVTAEKRTSSLLGSMNDPIFGRTNASLLTQLRLSSNEVDFGANAQIDSIVLLMKYQGSYGDTTQQQSFRVYELTKDLYFDSTYYSTQNMAGFYDPTAIIGTHAYYPKPEQDSILIRLSDDFGNKLLRTDTSYLSSNTTWLTYFKGLYLESDQVEQGGSIIYYDLTNGKSRLQLYYHNDLTDSLKFEVVINSNCSWVNLFNHNYSGSSIESKINDSLGTHQEVYLQSMGGLRAKLNLQLPEVMMSKLNAGVTINKAELIITLPVDPTLSKFGLPASLRVFNVGANNQNVFIPDLSLGEAYYGGSFLSASRTYRFNIGRHIQDLVHPDPDKRIANTGLFVVITDERTSANRIILDNKMKLVITYTPLQ